MQLQGRFLGRVVIGLGLLAWGPQPASAENTRIVSIGGSVTEIVYALGAGSRLVAVDQTSLHPPEAQDLPDVGYLRALSAEPILSLAPDLVLVEADAGPPEVLTQLESAGVTVTRMSDEPDIGGVQQKIHQVAAALGLDDLGAELARQVGADHARVIAQVAKVQTQPRVMFVLSAGRGAPLVAGEGTSAESIITLAGGRNAITGFPDYRPLSPEAGVAASPGVILVTHRTMRLLGGIEGLVTLPGIIGTPAADDRRIVAINGLLLLGFGPRTPEAVAELAEALHPGLEVSRR
ncbi:MAG: ABC transporter substrate-binding protein [Minwuia sp.]|nr:ABC transporter substrate-binding protein [Minwuia sp.]